MMDIQTALQIVLELARNMALDAEQREACDIVEDMAVNQFGDD